MPSDVRFSGGPERMTRASLLIVVCEEEERARQRPTGTDQPVHCNALRANE